MSTLLVILASGWKLLYEDINSNDNEDVYIPFIAITFIVHVVIAALTFVDIDASHKYHDYAGMQGWVLVVTKTLIYAYFCWCIYETYDLCRKKKEAVSYIQSLSVVGSAYMMAIPATVFVTFLYEPYERQYVYILVSEVLMFGANTLLLYLLASSNSSYRKASTDDITLPHNA